MLHKGHQCVLIHTHTHTQQNLYCSFIFSVLLHSVHTVLWVSYTAVRNNLQFSFRPTGTWTCGGEPEILLLTTF